MKQSSWKRLKKIVITFLTFVGAIVVVATLLKMPGRTEEEVVSEVLPLNVEVAEVKVIKSMPDVLELPGVIEPNRVVEVPVEQRGRIAEIYVNEGAAVSEGDLILRLDAALLEAELARTKAQADFDKSNFARSEELLKKGVVNQNQVDELKARAAVSAALLDVAQTNLDRATVRSPQTGILDELVREKGEWVGEGDMVARIVDVETVKAVVQIPERDAHFVKVGARIGISVDAFGGQKMGGTVTYISEVADAQTRTTPIEITLSNSERRLRGGMIVRAQMQRRMMQNVIMIPLASVIPTEDSRLVYIASEGRAEQRTVELGVLRGSDVQVVSGLESGDQLIVLGQRQVGPGQQIQIVKSR